LLGRYPDIASTGSAALTAQAQSAAVLANLSAAAENIGTMEGNLAAELGSWLPAGLLAPESPVKNPVGMFCFAGLPADLALFPHPAHVAATLEWRQSFNRILQLRPDGVTTLAELRFLRGLLMLEAGSGKPGLASRSDGAGPFQAGTSPRFDRHPQRGPQIRQIRLNNEARHFR
jgi:hypothetical protein